MNPKMARRMSRFIHLGMAAGKEAVADSGLDFATGAPSGATAWQSRSTPAGAAMEEVIEGRRRCRRKGARFV